MKGKTVWGAVFTIDDVDLGRLHATEGYMPGREKNAYRPEVRHVFLAEDDKQPAAELFARMQRP